MITLALGAFAAGFATSMGPCAAPRYLALVALCSKAHRGARWLRAALFATGIVVCYVLLAQAAASLGRLAHLSPWLYAAMALAFLALGVHTLATVERGQGCSHGASLFAGSAAGLLISPCCTPLLGFSGIAASHGSAAATLCIAAFAVGHVTPLALVPLGLQLQRGGPASATLNGGLSIALAAYCGLLA